MRVLGDLMTITLGDEAGEMVRKIFLDAGCEEEYERARVGLIEKGLNPNDITAWRLVLEGMSWKAEQNHVRHRMAAYQGRAVS